MERWDEQRRCAASLLPLATGSRTKQNYFRGSDSLDLIKHFIFFYFCLNNNNNCCYFIVRYREKNSGIGERSYLHESCRPPTHLSTGATSQVSDVGVAAIVGGNKIGQSAHREMALRDARIEERVTGRLRLDYRKKSSHKGKNYVGHAEHHVSLFRKAHMHLHQSYQRRDKNLFNDKSWGRLHTVFIFIWFFFVS